MLSGCGNLKDIKIPNSVEVIKYRAFAAEEYDGHIDNNPCELLAQVTIGSGVKSIEEYAFSGCQALEKITCLATTPPVMKDENCFDEECYSDATLFVPTEVIDVYASNTTWGRFMHIQPIVSDDVPGDVNGDGEVTVADANNVVDIVVMGGNSGHSRAPQADVNGDNEVNIADVNAIVDIILGDGTSIPSGFETITVNGVSFNMVKVEGGTFTMGAGDDDTEATEWERPAHMVTLSSFYIGQTEVTQALWQAVMGANPSWYSSRKGFEENLRRPVECVSWDDCMTFIETLNQMTGKQFRLPTEAEWEYAARGGNKSQGYRYSGSNTIGDVTWYYENSNDIMHPVATKSPNELGLFDMSGNVWEWCQDWLGEYSGSAQANPTGPISGTVRLMRGGSSSFDAIDCRVSNRDAYNPLEAIYDLGLRLVLDHDAD